MSFESEFDLVPLGDVADVIDSLHKTPSYVDVGYPMVRVTDVKQGQLDLTKTFRVTKETYLEFSRKYKPTRGDIIVTRVGSYGIFGRVFDTTFCLGQNTAAIVPKNISEDYLYAVLNSAYVNAQVESLVVGSTQKTLSLKAIKELRIPRLSNQQEKIIAEIAVNIDNRITLLRETNSTLEAIAQALFKSWFVDFDPVRANAEGRLAEGVDEATAALFPDAFDETELGQVPKGWNVESLDKTSSYLNGLALQKFPPTGQGDLPVIKIAQLRKGDTAGADLAASSIKPEYIIKNGDVLFSWSGSLEVDIWCGGNGALNQHLFKVTSSRFEKWFYYLWTKHHLASFRQIAESKATTMGHIQRAHLSMAKVVVPTDAIIAIANQLFTPLVERIVENTLQANTLSNLRDTLLPRLISGQLRIADAETELEKAMA